VSTIDRRAALPALVYSLIANGISCFMIGPGSRNSRQGLDLVGWIIVTESYDFAQINSTHQIPEIREEFWGDSGTHVPSSGIRTEHLSAGLFSVSTAPT
jgi:hypothetical protein